MEHYDCDDCFPRGEEDTHRRRMQRCTRLGMGRGEWIDVPLNALPRAYMGRRKNVASEDEELWGEHPLEDFEGGCPGAWYRSTFVASLSRYMPAVAEGQFQRCEPLIRCDSALVHEWVRIHQAEVLRHRSFEAEEWSRANKP